MVGRSGSSSGLPPSNIKAIERKSSTKVEHQGESYSTKPELAEGRSLQQHEKVQ